MAYLWLFLFDLIDVVLSEVTLACIVGLLDLLDCFGLGHCDQPNCVLDLVFGPALLYPGKEC